MSIDRNFLSGKLKPNTFFQPKSNTMQKSTAPKTWTPSGDVLVLLSLLNSDHKSDRYKALTMIEQRKLTVNNLADDTDTRKVLERRMRDAKIWGQQNAIA